MDNKKNVQMNGLKIVLIDTLLILGFTIPYNYSSYLLTDVARISVTASSSILAIVNVVGIFVTFIMGGMINNTRTKFGQFRPWIIGIVIAAVTGTLLMMLRVEGSVGIALAFVGYLAYTIGILMHGTCKYGIYNNLAGEDSEAKTLYSSRSWTGFNGGSMIAGFIILPMVSFFSGDSETSGWLITQLILAACSLLGVFMICKMGKSVDQPKLTVAENINDDKASIAEMVKAVVMNRSALTVCIYDTFRYIGGMYLIFIVTYQTAYVYGDMLYMSIAITGMAVACIIGTILCPYLTALFGGRKGYCRNSSIIMAAILAFMAFSPTSDNPYGFLSAYLIYYLFSAGADANAVMMYADAGEVWIKKTGKDTRAFLIAVQNVFITLGTSVASVILGVVLTAVGYETDVMLVGESAELMTKLVGGVPAVGYILAAIALLFHNISDKEIAEITKENVEAGFEAVE